MAKAETTDKTATVHARNIGGIDETAVDLTSGISILTGRNATNRTSFLQTIMAALGSDNVSLKGDADEGMVELTIDGNTYQRTLRRKNGTVVFSGDPYLEDSTTADLFSFLLESNEARQAVVRSDDLRDIIMRPVDIDEIEAEIDRLESKRTEIDDQLEELDSLKKDLPMLEQRKQEIESEIEEKRAELAENEAELESMDADVSETRAEKDELESRLADLRDLRSDLESVRSDIGMQEESIASLQRERAEIEEEQDEIPETPMEDRAHIDQQIETLRGNKRALETQLSTLQDVIQFNEQILGGEESAVTEALGGENSDQGALTDQLVEDDSVACWTCGSEVDPERIDETVDTIRSICQDQLEEIRKIENELDDLRAEKREREKQQRRRESLDRKLAEIEDEIDHRESRVEELRDQREEHSQAVETVEAEVEELESEDFSNVLDLHKEANQLEFELGRLESKRDDVTDRISSIESRLDEESMLQDRCAEIQDELERQRTRIDRIEQTAVEEFNKHMDEILDILGYENLARIWIERVQKTVREGRRKVERSVFELHVVRTTDSGTTYEDTIDHLSESEREITGLTFALAGYLVHDVHETVPFMLLDSLEAIDADRLAELVPYFADYVQYLVVALLPEDAQALPDRHDRVTEI
ncbi:archaea-specific SMC-related protein [Natronosalvus halobius]|uniref:archaea-specific SMC-related protein n=1 Tax=Natronosalvus halobius TaxID=2953746 RepID=UPI0020A0E090|nr:archaea-specific SMC-related protein [Natronosalvus halobius]USZ73615.1 AAA family ATPase [Natronosalvus halobius]